MRSLNWRHAVPGMAGLLLALALFLPADAATSRTWYGGAGPNWSEATNWSPGGVPQEGDLLTIGLGAPASTMNNNIPNLSLQRITFNDRDYILNGLDLTLGELTVSGGGVTGYNSITLNLKGEMRTLITEDGALRLSGTNSFTGDIDVLGRLAVESNTALGTSAGKTRVLSGGTLQLRGRDLGTEIVQLSSAGPSFAQVENALDSAIPNLEVGGPVAISNEGRLNIPNGLKQLFPGTEVFLAGGGDFLIGGASTANGTIRLINATSLAWNSNGPLNIVSGSELVPTSPTGDLTGSGTAAAVDFRGGTFAPGSGASAGRFTVIGELALEAASFSVTMNSNLTATGYAQATAGSVEIGPNTQLVLVQNFNPTDGQQFRIIDNTGNQPVGGAFAGLAEGATFTRGGRSYSITYKGGNGNDVVITRIADAPEDPLPFKQRLPMVARS